MKKQFCIFFLTLFAVCSALAQLKDDFSDGDFTANPNWIGTSDLFVVNSWHQLQSRASGSATAYLSTVSMVNYNATWSCSVRISTRPSAYNYARYYMCAENQDPTTGNALYVQVGGKKRNISLCIKRNDAQTILAETEEDVLSADDNRIELSIQFSKLGYVLSYKVGNDDYKTIRANTQDRVNSNYCSVYYSCTSKTGSDYYFDNIEAIGEVRDADEVLAADTSLLSNLIINEIMFEPAADNQEFVELYNKSEVPLLLSEMSLTTRNEDGEFRSGTVLPDVEIAPKSYIVLVKDAEQLCSYYGIESCELIHSVTWTRQLPNDGATIYLLYGEQVIVDSVDYSPKMHHQLLQTTKNVSLERISPDLPSVCSSWQSASAESGYATPARRNSQYIDIENEPEKSVQLSVERPNFSPNGDGFEDECVINYALPSSGYTATIIVFTPSGVRIASVTENQLLQQSGTISWNGMSDSGSVVQIGIYVISCELININTGLSHRKLLTVYVSAR